MSVEVDIELENAANVRVSPTEPPKRRAVSEPLVSPKLRRGLILAGIVLVAATLGLYLYFHNRESTDDAQVDGHITPVASKIYGRIGKVLVTDNEAVKAGQLLAQIDTGDYQAAVDQAKAALALAESDARSAGVDVPRTSENVVSGNSTAQAQLAVARADLVRAEATYEEAQTADLSVAEAMVARSKANAELARADLERYTPLMQKGEISKQQYDAAKANADASGSTLVADEQHLAQAQRNIDIARAQREAAKARVDEANAGVANARSDQKRVIMRADDAQGKIAKVEQARAGLEAAQLNLGYCNILAPVDGVATHKSVEPGQIVQPGQGLLVVVPLNDIWVTANFKETQLRNMRAGQKAYVKVDTYGQTFSGQVDSISGATGAVLSLLPPENATGNYVKVVQRIPVKIVLHRIPPSVAILRPGMNVDATVITK
jgi:membrane fusion protein, multidrug efflux system